ncbi:MAG TPA: ABC transporter permease [Opitutaceae bacterium]
MKPRARELALLAAIAGLFLLPLLGVPGFYTAGNLRNLLIDNLPVLVAAIGMTVVIVTAQIDISIGSQFVVCGALAGLAAKAGAPMPLVVLAVLAAGALLGALNGALVTRAGIPAIITTLATMVILRNGIIRATGGDWIQNLPPGFQWFGLDQSIAQPLYALAAAALFGAAAWALRHSAAGRAFYAVGCDHEAARRVGLNPPAVVLGAFVLMGALTAAAALFNFTRYPTIETNAGLGFELKVIAAVVVGGTAITGGRGSLVGTLLGVVLLGTIGTVLTFLHVNPAWEKAVQGAIILAAVVSDTARSKEAAT